LPRSCFILLVSFLLLPSAAVALPISLPHQIIDTSRVQSAEKLMKIADLIVAGRYHSPTQTVRTGRKVNAGQIVTYIQPFEIKQLLKGRAGSVIRIASSGVDPLPPAKDPLNTKYPGPMAEGDYVCFLKRLDRQNIYYVIGGWQGVYPLYNGQLIALQDAGFPSFQGLTIAQLRQLLKQ